MLPSVLTTGVSPPRAVFTCWFRRTVTQEDGKLRRVGAAPETRPSLTDSPRRSPSPPARGCPGNAAETRRSRDERAGGGGCLDLKRTPPGSGVKAKKATRKASTDRKKYHLNLPPPFPPQKAQAQTKSLRKIPGKVFHTGRAGPLPSPGAPGERAEFAAREGLAGEWGGARARGAGAEYLQRTGTGKEFQNSRVLFPTPSGVASARTRAPRKEGSPPIRA